MEIFRVWRISDDTIDVEGQGKWPRILAIRDREDGQTHLVRHIRPLRPGVWRLSVNPLRRDRHYDLIVHNHRFFVDFSEAYWAQFTFDGWLGVQRRGKKTIFRLFAPRASRVILSLFEHPYHETAAASCYKGEIQLDMHWKKNGVWELVVEQDCLGYYYGYRVFGPTGPGELFNPTIIVADPYAKAIASFLVYPQRHLGVIVEDNYSWKTPFHLSPLRPHEWIIYECHLRDMTMLSTGCTHPGTYEGFAEKQQKGGIAHLQDLGVNAVEFLPLQEFCEIEPPFGTRGEHHILNNFNPYSRNHWGYMTTSFFAPESYYLTGNIQAHTWNGIAGHQSRAMKAMVDTLHEAGIRVIMDVVYNHVSLYDYNALRLIDRRYYFWTTPDGHDDQKTYCGNDFRSDRPMARKLILESLEHWVREYRIDGFRFDLGTVIDWETYKQAISRLKKIKPDIFLTAEPWHGGRGGDRDGGDYCLLPGKNGFSRMGMSAWNDRFRNLIRGGTHATEHPSYGLVFGKVSSTEIWEAVQCYPSIFEKPWHSVNYIESHDNHTFTDFLRIGNGDMSFTKEIKPEILLEASRLTQKQLDQSKLAAFVLFLSPGVVMLHEGQEFGRMRIVHPPDGSFSLMGNVHWHKNSHGEWIHHHHHWPHDKPKPWTIDGDGYEKDNPSNWIDWRLRDVNKTLYDFYKSLIRFRRDHGWIGMMLPSRIDPEENGVALGWCYHHGGKKMWVLTNAGEKNTLFSPPPWSYDIAFTTHPEEEIGVIENKLSLPSLRGIVLKQK